MSGPGVILRQHFVSRETSRALVHLLNRFITVTPCFTDPLICCLRVDMTSDVISRCRSWFVHESGETTRTRPLSHEQAGFGAFVVLTLLVHWVVF